MDVAYSLGNTALLHMLNPCHPLYEVGGRRWFDHDVAGEQLAYSPHLCLRQYRAVTKEPHFL